MNRKSSKTTLTDIAVKLGITESTVSKALRGETDVSADTAAKIRAAAAEMGYDDSRLNSRIRGVPTVGVVFAELNSEYYHGMYESFRRRLTDEGWRVVTMVTDLNDAGAIVESVEFLIRKRVGGLFVLAEVDVDLSGIRRLIEKTGTPAVFVSNMTDVDFCDSVNINHAIGVRLPLSAFYDLGHERIAFVGDRYTGMRERLFRRTVGDRTGSPVPEELVAVSDERASEGGYISACRLLDLPEKIRPTAILAAYDDLAYGVYRAAAERGLSIPDDLSVASIDDNQASACINPGLTSVTVPVKEIGARAAELILARAAGDASPFNTLLLTPKLVERGSIAAPKGLKR